MLVNSGYMFVYKIWEWLPFDKSQRLVKIKKIIISLFYFIIFTMLLYLYKHDEISVYEFAY